MDNFCFEDISDNDPITSSREKANIHRYQCYFLRLYKRNPKAQEMISEILAEGGVNTYPDWFAKFGL